VDVPELRRSADKNYSNFRFPYLFVYLVFVKYLIKIVK